MTVSTETLQKYMADRRKMLRTRIGVLAVLCVVAIAYLSWIQSHVRTFDADSVVAIASTSIEENIPQMRQLLAQRLENMAPAVFDTAEEHLLSAPGILRQQAESRVRMALRERLPTYRIHLEGLIDKMIDEAVTTLNSETNPGADRVEQVLTAAIENYGTNLTAFFTTVGSDYKAEAMELNAYLAKLGTGEGLTEKQGIERNVILSSLALADAVTASSEAKTLPVTEALKHGIAQ